MGGINRSLSLCAGSSTARQQAMRSSALCKRERVVYLEYICVIILCITCVRIVYSNGVPETGLDVIVLWTNYCVVYCNSCRICVVGQSTLNCQLDSSAQIFYNTM